jgi:hypothetical protein
MAARPIAQWWSYIRAVQVPLAHISDIEKAHKWERERNAETTPVGFSLLALL